ncbi:SLBB domain-containing protein [Pseudomonadota bacterium]|nr:SLBB domain-containing protein [Pseudomonadota bacterium]
MNLTRFYLIFLISIPQLMAQSFPDNFSNDMQKQFFALSQEQKEAIASQYGIDLDELNNAEPSKPSLQYDKRYQDDQAASINQQQLMPDLSYLRNQDSLSQQTSCFDQNGNPIIVEPQTNEKLDITDQNICYDRFGNPLDFPDYIETEDGDNLEDEELTRFGLTFFDNKISTFSPFENVPIPDDYILGAGDEISIKYVGAENSLLNLTIERNGTVFVPKIGEITLSGIPFNEAINIIQSRIQQELIGVTAFVTMGRIKSINIFIAGEVNFPGMYSISALSTITQSLYQAGGISDIGSLRNIKVLRNGEEISVFDLYDLLIYGNSRNDIRLRSGDVVFVPPYESLIEAKGSFKRANIYELKAGDTFADLLNWTGGFDGKAYPIASSLKRYSSIGMIATVTNINLLLSDNLDKKLFANDLITVPESSKDQRAYISVEGAFNRPGKFGWFDGMKVSDILSTDKDYLLDFNNETDFEIGLIERFNQQTKSYSVLDFSPINILDDSSSKSNIQLNEFDTLYFLPKNKIDRFLLLQPFVKRLEKNNVNGEGLKVFTISGDVKFPGTYPLPSKISLLKALKISGGVTDTAYLESIEVSRTIIDNSKTNSRVFEISASNSSHEASNFEILSRDKINVRINEELVLQKTFSIEGFIKFPGVYPLNTGETLSSAISRAGGLKENAFSNGARLIRKTLIDTQTKQNQNLAESIRASYASSLLTSEQKLTSIQDIELVAQIIENMKGEGRLVINLEEAIAGNRKFDIFLEDGDALIIPQLTNIINIIGEVRNPNVVNYSDSFDTEDYLSLAGGLSQRADSDNIYIIRANGSIVSLEKSIFSLGLSKPRFQPGDTLVVPIKENYQDPLPLWSQVTQIIYQSMVSIAAVKGL